MVKSFSYQKWAKTPLYPENPQPGKLYRSERTFKDETGEYGVTYTLKSVIDGMPDLIVQTVKLGYQDLDF